MREVNLLEEDVSLRRKALGVIKRGWPVWHFGVVPVVSDKGIRLSGPSRHRMWLTNVPEIHHKDKRIQPTAMLKKDSIMCM